MSRTESLLAGLNPDQQAAVTATEGPVLVVAGPGSGKTRVLTHRIAHLIEDNRVPPERILAVTFTNKAAREMRDRIERLLGAGNASGLVMGTFHSFGVRLLRQNPGLVADRLDILPNFLIYDDADQIEIAKRSIVEIGLDPKQLAPRRLLGRISAAKSMLIGPDEFVSQVESYDDEVVARVYRGYQRGLRRANAVDFDDLLSMPIRLFDEAPSLLANYQDRFLHILVDEYQDTNRVQYVMVSALAAQHRNLFVVGDPDQSIYGWRQADIRNILDFEKDYPDAQRIHLEINYRSTGRIVDAADRVIRENTQRIDRRLRTDNDEGNPVVIQELADHSHEAQYVVSEIRRLIARNGFDADDVAVMYRTTAQSRVLEEAFRTSEIPYRIIGGVRFYERKEVKDVLAVLRLLHNPADEISLQRVIDNLPLGRGIGPIAVDEVRAWATQNHQSTTDGFVTLITPDPLRSGPKLSGNARTAGHRLGVAIGHLRTETGNVPLTSLFDSVVERTGYRASFNLESEEEMQRWANVLELRADLEKYDILSPADALATYLEQVALISDVDAMDANERSRVTLITLHSAKGLEFPVVFIAGVEEGLLPINRAVDVEFEDPLQLEEERRLFYVGITRAQQLLYLTYAQARMTYGRYQHAQASRFLDAVPGDRNRRSRGSDGYRHRGQLQGQVRSGFGSSLANFDASRSSATALPETVRYSVGQRVFHVKFGEGMIVDVKERDSDQELGIRFSRHGDKRLLASFAPLDVI